jgi:hypothetical protein
MILFFSFFISACTTGSGNALQDLSLPQYGGVNEVPMESIHVGDSREFVAGKLGVGQFPWGRTHSFGLKLPVGEKPYYLVIKSYFVSTATHLRYATDKTAGFWEPRVFFPYVTFLDKAMNIVGRSDADDFHVNSDIHPDFLRTFVGESWIQAAFAMDETRFPGARYAVVSTSSEFVGKVGAVSNFYWPFGGGYWFPQVVYAPILGPMASYKGPMVTVRYGNVGDIQVQAVAPKELLLSASFGRKASTGNPPTITPGTLLKEEPLLVRTPAAGGYEMVKSSTSRTVHVAFSKHLPDGRGDVAMFAQSFKLKIPTNDAKTTVQKMVEDAVKEHTVNLRDLKFHASVVPSAIGFCQRVDFEGAQPRSYLAKIKGYDVLCVTADKNLTVRIGASVLTSPASAGTEELPVEAAEFLSGISLAAE